MTLRCKAGDLALVIRNGLSVTGKMVTCIRLEDPVVPGTVVPKSWRGATWFVDREVTWHNTVTGAKVALSHLPDVCLLPIRPEPDPEEFLINDGVSA